MPHTECEFILGSTDIPAIDGWHYGVAGMKIGSKRTLTCPPNSAYGAQGLLPFVPGNSTVIFDIELQTIKKWSKNFQE